MKEAFGGIVSIVFITIFLVVVMGILGLVVVYTKAFHMKDEIISTIEEYEGSGCCPEDTANCGGSSVSNSACRERIKKKATELGYHPGSLNCPTGYYKADDLYCYKIESITIPGQTSTNKKMFTIITQVDVNFPIVERIFGFRFFQVGGDTEVVEFQYE